MFNRWNYEVIAPAGAFEILVKGNNGMSFIAQINNLDDLEPELIIKYESFAEQDSPEF